MEAPKIVSLVHFCECFFLHLQKFGFQTILSSKNLSPQLGELMRLPTCFRGWNSWNPENRLFELRISPLPPMMIFVEAEICPAGKIIRKHRPIGFFVVQAQNWKIAADLDYRYFSSRWTFCQIIDQNYLMIEFYLGELNLSKTLIWKEKSSNFSF